MHPYLSNIRSDSEALIPAEKALGVKMTMAYAVHMVGKLASLYLGKTKKAFPSAEAFEARPIVFDPPADAVLSNDTIIVVTSYPFGSHRCLHAMWLEKCKGGQVRQVVVDGQIIGQTSNTTYAPEGQALAFLQEAGFYTEARGLHSPSGLVASGIDLSSDMADCPEKFMRIHDTVLRKKDLGF